MSVKVMGAVWDLKIGRDEKFVLLAYADHANHDGSSIYPAVKTIVEKTGYSERSVQSITKSLEKAGLLIADGHGTHGTNRWRIPICGGCIVGGAEFAPVQDMIQEGAEKDAEGCRNMHEGVQPTAPEPSFNHPLNHQLTSSTGRANIFELYENNFGLLTPMIADTLKDAEQTYPAEWIKVAMTEAVTNNKRNWKYVEAILKRWKAEGFILSKIKSEKSPRRGKSAKEIGREVVLKLYGK